MEGGGGRGHGMSGEVGDGLEDGGEGEGAGAVGGAGAEGREVEPDSAARATLVRGGADEQRPRRIDVSVCMDRHGPLLMLAGDLRSRQGKEGAETA